MPRATTAEDQAFIELVKGSLRNDVRCGFLIPSASSAAEASANAELVGERAKAVDMPLDLNLLPPMSAMSPLQKRAVQRQLEIRVHAREKLRKAARLVLPLGRRTSLDFALAAASRGQTPMSMQT